MVCIDLEEKNQIEELLAIKNYDNSVIERVLSVSSNYNGQGLYIYQKAQEQIKKIENEIEEKWNLKKGLYLSDDNVEVSKVLLDTLGKKVFNATDITELKEEKFWNNTKEAIEAKFNEALDKSKEENELSNKTMKLIKADVQKLVNKCFDEMADKLFNNKSRDKLEKMCDNWEKEYKKLNHEKMNSLADNLLKMCNKGSLYKDNELEKRIQLIVAKNQFIQNELKNGGDGKISDIEESVIKCFFRNE